MALILNKDQALATLAGIYQGQIKPVKIGPREYVFQMGGTGTNDSPHFVSFTLGEDSVGMQAFFDPSRSTRIAAGNYPVSYIQVGRFCVNGIALPVSIYKPYVPYPVTDVFIDNPAFGRFLSHAQWTDVAAEDSNNNDILSPLYPYWKLEEDANYPQVDFLNQPQRFGSVYHNIDTPLNGRYLCAYMNKSEEITLGKFPTSSNSDDYFKTIDTSDLIKAGTLPAEIATAQNFNLRLNEIINYFIYGGSEIQPLPRISSRNGSYQIFLSTYNRLYFHYQSRYTPTGSRPITEKTRVLAYTNEEGGIDFSFMDEDLIEEYRDELNRTGVPDFNKIEQIIEENCGKFSYFKSNDIKLGYEYVTYACQFHITDQIYQIRLLEGFSWKTEREFKNGSWNNISFRIDPLNPFGYHESIFKETIDLYFERILISKKLQWV